MGIAIIAKGADFSENNIGTVTPSTVVNLLSLSISGPSSIEGKTAQFSAVYTPSNTTQKGVVWSIESGGTYATIDASTGQLTVLSGADGDDVVIKATSSKNASIYATKTVNVTYQSAYDYYYDWAALLETNQTDWQANVKTPNIDGHQYWFIKNDNTKIGQSISAVKTSGMDYGAVKVFKIPCGGASKLRVPVMKSSSGFGYAWTDENDIITGLYMNTTIDSGTYQELTVPAGTAFLWLPLSNSVYTALGENMVVEQTE